MVRSLCMGPVVMVLALTGLAWGQPEPASAPPPKELRQAVITVQEPEKPNIKARVLATWFLADGSRAFQVQALTSGEMLTVVEVGPPTRAPGANGKFFQAVATRIYHWGGTVPPEGVPMPPQNHPVVAFQPTPPVTSAPTGVQMVRPTVEPARRLASNGPGSKVTNENRVWPPAYGTCANCTHDPIKPADVQTLPESSAGISPYAVASRMRVAQASVPAQPFPTVPPAQTLATPVPHSAYPPVATVKAVVATNGQTSDGVVNPMHKGPVPFAVMGQEPSGPRGTQLKSPALVSQVSSPDCLCDTVPPSAPTSPPRVGQARATRQGYQAGSSPLVSQAASPNCACDTITTTPPIGVVQTPVIIQREGLQPSKPVVTVRDQPPAPRGVYGAAPQIITVPGPTSTTAGLASQTVPPGMKPTGPASQPANSTKNPYAVVDASAEKPKQGWTGGLLPRVLGWKDESKTTSSGTGSGSTVVSKVTDPVRPANGSVGQPTPTDVGVGKNPWGNTPLVQAPPSPSVKPNPVGSIDLSKSSPPVAARPQGDPVLPRLDPPAIQTQPMTPPTPVASTLPNSTLVARLDPAANQSQPGSSPTASTPNPAPPAAGSVSPVNPSNTAPAKPSLPVTNELVQGQTGSQSPIPFADKSKPDPLEDLGSYTKIPGLEGKLTTPKVNAANDAVSPVKGNQSSPAPINQASPNAPNGSGKTAGPTTPLVKPVNPVTPVTPLIPVAPITPVTPVTPVAPLPPITPATPPPPVTRTSSVVSAAPMPPGTTALAISAPPGRQSIMAAQAAAQQVAKESRFVPGAVAPISVSALEGNAFSPPTAPQGSGQPAEASVLQRTAGTTGPVPANPLPPGGPMMPYGPPAMGPYQGPARPMMGMQPPPFSAVRCPIATGYANAFTQAGNPNPIPADANTDVSNTDNAFQSIQGATLPVPVQGFSNVPSTFPAPDMSASPPMESGATVDPNLTVVRRQERDSFASKPSNGAIVPVNAQVFMPGQLDNARNPVSLPELLAILNDSLYPSQREVAAEYLCSYDWRIHPQIAEVVLHAAQIDPAPLVRIACIHALVKQKASTTYCVQALQTIKTSDKNEQVRKEAETALRTLTPAAVPSATDRSVAR